MYAGRVIEEAPVDALFANPRHPYTQGLIRSIPRIDTAATRKERLEAIPGVVPNLLNPPPGCRFAPRCPHVMARCHTDVDLLEVDGELVRCVLYDHEAELEQAAAAPEGVA
jgi:peptide/nickel transport system ATP-binding protein